MQSLYTWMQAAEVDMTIFFRSLAPSEGPTSCEPDRVWFRQTH